jgi:hypothetical protein
MFIVLGILADPALSPFIGATWTVREHPWIVLAVAKAVAGGSHLINPLPIGGDR